MRTRADELLSRYLLKEARRPQRPGLTSTSPAHYEIPMHLLACPTTTAIVAAEDGFYGCETGCEYLRFAVRLACTCPGVKTYLWEYGQFGELRDLIDDLIKEDAREQREAARWSSPST
ncbi:MAG: hypothetical protein JWO67_6487 [Streptosporangiaceae bacterium]|nr:hypothetical protein [Streptosporangiaceae bacterium]